MNKKMNGKKGGQMMVTNDNKTNGGGKIKPGKMEEWEDGGNGKNGRNGEIKPGTIEEWEDGGNETLNV